MGAQEYEEVAVALGTDHARRLDLRRRLKDTRLTCPLFDTSGEAHLDLSWKRKNKPFPPLSTALEPGHVRSIDIATLSCAEGDWRR